jgi:polyhydroxybutyrate depolymerase
MINREMRAGGTLPGAGWVTVAIALLWLMIACSGPTATSPSAALPAATSPAPTAPFSAAPHAAGCGVAPSLPLETGTVEAITVGGVERSYRLGLPGSYDGLTPAPLVLNLHGADETGANLAAVSGIEIPAWTRGYVVVHPDAIDRLWNFEDDSDVEFLTVLMDALADALCLDPSRTYAAGLSQGGDFASFMACQVPRRVAAFASVAVLNAYERCATWTPTPVLAFAGTADPIYVPDVGLAESVPFSGDPLDKPGPLADEAGTWALANGCDAQAAESSAGGVTTISYDCPPGADVQILVHAGGHTWPGGAIDPPPFLGPAVPDLDASTLILDFFDRHATR